jgi:hypothetical protein
LEALMRELGISTKKDLFNQALTLLEWAARERRTGRIIASVDEASEQYKQVLLPALERVAPRPQPADDATHRGPELIKTP